VHLFDIAGNERAISVERIGEEEEAGEVAGKKSGGSIFYAASRNRIDRLY
jgi:hypothetical protein